jgi:cytochrome P450
MRPRIQQVVDETLDAIVGQGHMDLIEFCVPLPVTIICDMLGIPEDHREQFYVVRAMASACSIRCAVAGRNRARQCP